MDVKIQQLNQKIADLQDSLTLQHSKPDRNYLSNLQKVIDLKEEQQQQSQISQELDTECRYIWDEQMNENKNTRELNAKTHWLYMRYLAWTMAIGFSVTTLLYKLAYEEKKHQIIKNEVTTIKEILQKKNESSLGGTLYDWGAWACRPIKYLKFW